jgi:hypothetical protein
MRMPWEAASVDDHYTYMNYSDEKISSVQLMLVYDTKRLVK